VIALRILIIEYYCYVCCCFDIYGMAWQGGVTPLDWAAWMGQMPVVKYLIKLGVDVNVSDNVSCL